MTYTKENLLIDLDEIASTFRALLFAVRVTFDAPEVLRMPIGRLAVNAMTRGEDCFIEGSEFAQRISSPAEKTAFFGSLAAFARANLLIAFSERIKGYCNNTTTQNKERFRKTNDREHSALYVLKCLRDSATHWLPENIVKLPASCGDQLAACGIEIRRGMNETELPITNANLLALVGEVRRWVADNLE